MKKFRVVFDINGFDSVFPQPIICNNSFHQSPTKTSNSPRKKISPYVQKVRETKNILESLSLSRIPISRGEAALQSPSLVCSNSIIPIPRSKNRIVLGMKKDICLSGTLDCCTIYINVCSRLYNFLLNGTFLSEGEFHHTRDSSPVKNGFSHIDPMLEVDSLIYQLYHVLLYVFLWYFPLLSFILAGWAWRWHKRHSWG